MSDNNGITIWRYSVPPVEGRYGGWGIFLLDSSGMFSVVSDYGNYAFKWSSFGPCFRSFLCRIDASYLGGKLNMGRDDVYDEERSQKLVREYILQRRRQGDMTRKQAADEWELSEDMESFDVWYHHTKFDDAYEFYVSSPPRQLVAFCEQLYPRLVEMLRRDLAEEREA